MQTSHPDSSEFQTQSQQATDPRLRSLSLSRWGDPVPSHHQSHAFSALEDGCVLALPKLSFALEPAERRLLNPELALASKNISLAYGADRPEDVRGIQTSDDERRLLHGLMSRYAGTCDRLLAQLLPDYHAAARRGRTSFRPAEIEGRSTSWRKDDSRLHVDSFPSSPTSGWRILRVFSNIHPHGRPRSWRLGEPFEVVASRFLPNVRAPIPGSSALLRALRVTKARRTPYDHYMLALHDRMKFDLDYQAGAAQQNMDFAPSSSWLVFTDQVSHAAMSGQFALEQTFLLPMHAMRQPASAPLRVLEGLLGRPLT